MENLLQLGNDTIMNTYGRLPIIIDHGVGCYLYDKDGTEYLDFVSGIAVNSLGYSNDKLKDALKNQIDQFFHCSNLYYNEPNIRAAQLLANVSGLDRVFFCNSGAEAVEAGFKLARKYAKKFYSKDKTEIIAMKNSFHGRTYGAVSLTGQLKYQKGLEPLVPNIFYGEYNNIESVKALVNENTCGIIVEIVQGEGGIIPGTDEFLKGIRELCDSVNALMIVDEVQTGVCRLGNWYGFQGCGVKPDIVASAKGLGGGFPVGAMLATEKAAKGFEPGDHASTFGGNALASAAVVAVIEEMMEKDINAHVANMNQYIVEELLDLQKDFPAIIDIRGKGLMIGVELNETISAAKIIQMSLKKGLLLVRAGENTFRLVPPLVVSTIEIDQCMTILKESFSEYQAD